MSEKQGRAPEEEEKELLALGFEWNEATQSYRTPPEVSGFEDYGGSLENFLAGKRIPRDSQRPKKPKGKRQVAVVRRRRK